MKKERNQEGKLSYEEAKGRFLVIKQISVGGRNHWWWL